MKKPMSLIFMALIFNIQNINKTIITEFMEACRGRSVYRSAARPGVGSVGPVNNA